MVTVNNRCYTILLRIASTTTVERISVKHWADVVKEFYDQCTSAGCNCTATAKNRQLFLDRQSYVNLAFFTSSSRDLSVKCHYNSAHLSHGLSIQRRALSRALGLLVLAGYAILIEAASNAGIYLTLLPLPLPLLMATRMIGGKHRLDVDSLPSLKDDTKVVVSKNLVAR